MKFKNILFILLAVVLSAAACQKSVPESNENDSQTAITQAPYGYFYLGEEEIPVVTFTSVYEELFLLKISPLENIMDASTYAVIGVKPDFDGVEIDVETKFHNDDYLFVYEDPTRYYAPYRVLQSGTIFLERKSAEEISVNVDVVLYDGTPFKYENDSLKTIIND